jgi:dTDP-4-amino-4,6-dideoxygalactose transaminase
MVIRATAAPEQERTRVPFFDLAPTHAPLRDPLAAAIAAVVSSSAFTNGPDVAAFEREFAAACGTSACVGVSSGLDALKLILRGLGVGPGDEVVVPAQTFLATAEAVVDVGASPVLADVGSDRNLDLAAAEAAIGPRTRALLPVHLHGQMADVRGLAALASRHGIALVEDACQAHGAERDGVLAGQGGDAAAFSFYPAKNLGAFGDAGAITTGSDVLAEACRALREHGQAGKYNHVAIGYTARLDTIQAAVLRVKLPRLPEWNAARAWVAAQYAEMLDGVGDLVLPPQVPDSVHAWHVYVVETGAPDPLQAFLEERGIGCGRHYPTPLHLSPALEGLGHGAGSFPVAERLAARSLSLPIFPGMAEAQVEAVATAVRAYFDRGR